MTKERIGIIGVGLMGHGIALNIVTKGWPLGYLYHPGNQPSDDLLEAGAQQFDDVAGLAAESDILLLCVTGTPQVEDVLTGSGDLLANLRPAWWSSTVRPRSRNRRWPLPDWSKTRARISSMPP